MAKVIIALGNDISTDDIYPGRYMATVLPTETPQFCFADRTELNAALRARSFEPGSVIVADENFGCGSSREQAVSALKGYELTIVATSISRIFLQNAINLGLHVVTCPGLLADEGHELEISETQVLNRTTGRVYDSIPLPPARQAIIDAGGLIEYTRRRLMHSPTTMTITSPAFTEGGEIPRSLTCQGEDRSPALAWSDVPAGTKSLALIVDDPDAPDPMAPKMTYVHWVLYNIPASAPGLPEGVMVPQLPAGTSQGLNDWKRTGYGGPCPPIGRHRYFFKLYALDTLLPDLGETDKPAVERAMAGHIVAHAALMGTYQKAR